MKRIPIALLAGLLFGLGLTVSGMTDPDKVLNFLDVAGRWDPSLALVMGGALLVAVPGFALARRRGRSVVGEPLPPPPGSNIDKRLLVGSGLFGIGWGIAGFCPGPALANLVHATDAIAFVIALLAGSQLARFAQRN
ncbi:MAG: YeeE/YedE family protein [Lysobacteraceae bacterium]|nr:MAG: YeeE/YedE family protein [Xanthomonadaceae bacterium]